uniref:Uncharacterized protein n=1 Tax=Nelumbo nucifera TaxID=4432 RepID=A0A822Y6B7_NELNU|nr:TPA_asm: hypothetical protein HUJ06_026602 [Nelumbo nucifera]
MPISFIYTLSPTSCLLYECLYSLSFRKFWWGETNDSKKAKWIWWNQVCKNKQDEGDLYAFNLVPLAKNKQDEGDLYAFNLVPLAKLA